MRKPENIFEVQQIINQKNDALFVNRLADALAFIHFISCDRSNLVWCLGIGNESSNLLALRTWVRKKLSNKIDLSENNILQVLSMSLREHLEKVKDRDWI